MIRVTGIGLGVLALSILAYAGAALADAACGVAAHLVHSEASLPHVADSIAKTKTLKILVVGTTSSTLPGAAGQTLAYPARLEAALQKKLPDVTVTLISMAKPRQTAADMAEAFPKLLRDEKPALVIWQTGTYDAMRGVSPESFQATLESAVDRLQEGGADVIFMNMQYSPRTEAVISTVPYADAIRWVALEHAVNVFDRQAVMRQWSELGTFDFLTATKSLDTAAKVHDCLGTLLGDLIVEALAGNTAEPSKEIPKQ
jgi:ABC-type amino acid transport substrate-binding protein